ncbi:hypothetical protein VNI00_018293 [Paramarasmius palmivorus]|uniref:F-box domain-containing protein n=1 Tax=Paramarasmius palmivorus TaxID=297713 RepID=A0AAW0B055_9AGAR
MDKFSTLPHTIVTPICDQLPLGQLAALRKVSPTVREQVLDYSSSAFGLTKLYGDFFPSLEAINAFRVVQAKCRALVSGSAVVSFLSRGSFLPGDLDILVPSSNVVELGTHLLRTTFAFDASPLGLVEENQPKEAQIESFVRAATAPRDSWLEDVRGILEEGYDELTVSGVFNFSNGDGRRVQIIGTKCEPIEFVLQFYSTLVMNVVTATRVISLYPNTSFVRNAALYLKFPTDRVASAVSKYEDRGWTSDYMISAEKALHADHELSTKTRWVGDRHCWMVLLPPVSGLTEDSYHGLSITSWHLYCPSPNAVRVQTNRMEPDYLPYPLVVTWEAERAVWRHECLWGLTPPAKPSDTVSDPRSNGVRGATALERSMDDDNTGNLDTCSSEMDAMEHASGNIGWDRFFLNDDGRYQAIDRWWNHVGHNSIDMEKGIVEFLGNLYPKLDDEHRTNRILIQLRKEFEDARAIYGGVALDTGLPSGYTVSTILQCMKEVQNTGLCDDIEFDMRFWFDWNELSVWTTCVILVPPKNEVKIKKSLPLWQYGSSDFTGLLVEISVARLEKGQAAQDVLLGGPSPKELLEYHTPPSTIQNAMANYRIGVVTEVMLRFFTSLSTWNLFRRWMSTCGALLGGALVLGCFTVPNTCLPLEIYVIAERAKLIMRFLISIGYSPVRSTGNRSWFTSLSEMVVQEDYSCARSPMAAPHTSTVDDRTYVSDVYEFDNPEGRRIQVIVPKLHAMDVVLHMSSTKHMNFISATHMTMLYPALTLQARVEFDHTLPLDSEQATWPGFLGEKAFVTNPRLSPSDVVQVGTSQAAITRRVGDKHSLTFTLHPCSLPLDVFAPGNPALVACHSWQFRQGINGRSSVSTIVLSTPRLREMYVLSPHVHDALDEGPALPWLYAGINTADGAVTSGQTDRRFVSLLSDLYRSVLDTDSPRCRIAENIRRSLVVHPQSTSAVQSGVSCVTSSTLFNALCSVPALRDGSAQFEFKPEGSAHSVRKVVGKLVIRVSNCSIVEERCRLPYSHLVTLEKAGVVVETKVDPGL